MGSDDPGAVMVHGVKMPLKMVMALSGGLILSGMLACKIFTVPESPLQPVIGIDKLRFKDPETGRRFLALNACINDRLDDNWYTSSYRLLGNFYQSDWCRGVNASTDCNVPDPVMQQRDQQAVELYTLFYDNEYPQVFGLGFHTYSAPAGSGWGSSFSFAEGGGSVVGEGWGVTFNQYKGPSGRPDASVPLGLRYEYSIGDNPIGGTTINTSSSLPLREDLAGYLKSPKAMRDRGLEGLQALAQKVDEAIRSHTVPTCDRGPYLGNGLPPVCKPRAMTAEEEAAELTRSASYFASQEGLLREYYNEMYAAWMTAFPLNQCWP